WGRTLWSVHSHAWSVEMLYQRPTGECWAACYRLPIADRNRWADIRHANRSGELLPVQRQRVWVDRRPDIVHRHRHGDRNRQQRHYCRAEDGLRDMCDLSVGRLRDAVNTTYLG